MIFIIAGNYSQARYWAHDHGLQWGKDTTYIDDVCRIHGRARGQNFVKIGTYYQKSFEKQIHIEELLRVYGATELNPDTLGLIK